MICQPVWKRQNEAVKVIEYIGPAVSYALQYMHLPLQETAPLNLQLLVMSNVCFKKTMTHLLLYTVVSVSSFF